jgi:hypothetical protein
MKTAACAMYEFVYKTDSFRSVIIIILLQVSEEFVLTFMMTGSLLVLPPQVLTRMRIVVSFSVNFRVLSLNVLSSKLQRVYRLQMIKMSIQNSVRNGTITGRSMNEASPIVLGRVIYTAG